MAENLSANEAVAAPPKERGWRFYLQGTWLFLKKMWPAIWDLTESETYVHASSIAFNVLMSFFSFIVLIGGFLVNVLGWQQGYETAYRMMLTLFPAESGALLRSLDKVTRGPSGQATLISFALLIFSSSGIFQPLELALNRAWKFPERNVVKQYLLYLPLTVVCGLLILGAVAFASPWDFALGKLLGDNKARQFLFAVIGTTVSLPFMVLIFFVIYYLVPHGKVPAVQVFFASMATAALLVLTTLVFRLLLPVLDFQGSYKELSSLMALITWVFICSFILILGANLSARDVLPRSWTRSA
jgi:uncharacterized BrkB/YihY/UPF0761 family membrane protein